MASRKDRPKRGSPRGLPRGRVTPRKDATPPGRARAARRPSLFRRPTLDPNDPTTLGQVGRRPSPPRNLLVIGVLWVGTGILVLFTWHVRWKLIPAIVLIGVGMLFLRGGFTASVRQQARRRGDL